MADRYWVGGGGTWNNNSGGRWSYYSGGPGGYGNPGPTDNAIFDANSGGGTVNVATGRNCYNLLLSGYTGTFTGARSTYLYIYGQTVTLPGPSGIFAPGNGPVLYFNTGYTGNPCILYTNGSPIGDIVNYRYLLAGDHISSKNNSKISNYSIFNAAGFDVTVGEYYDANNGDILYMGSGTWQILMAGPINGSQTCWTKTGGSLDSSTSILRFLRGRGSCGLRYAIGSGDTTIYLTNPYIDNALTQWPSSGTIQIDDEIISYSGITYTGSPISASAATLTGCTRGLRNSWQGSHSAGKPVVLLGTLSCTLTSNLGSGDGTMYVDNATNMEGNGYVEVGGEIIAYSGKSGTTALTGLSRGQTTYGGSAAAFHASGTTVRQAETRYMSLGNGFVYNILEFGTAANYQVSVVNDNFVASTVRTGPYLPNNPFGMQYLNFTGLSTITNFKIAGQRGTQGLPAQPIYANVSSLVVSSRSNTNLLQYVSGYPSGAQLPYTYIGDDSFDFGDFLLQSVGPTFNPTPITYSIGAAGVGGNDTNDGGNGGTTTVTYKGVTITAYGGAGGVWNGGSNGAGGGYTGGDGGSNGGYGYIAGGDIGGGGGGGICGINGSGGGQGGGPGGNMGDISGLQTALTGAGGTVGSGGGGASSGSDYPDNMNGGAGSGYGAGGGGAGWYGGHGGDASYGGGGGGAAGYTASRSGGYGGAGFIVISINNGSSYVVLTSGSSYTPPSGVSIKIWAVGGGGGGAGSGAYDGNSGGGGGAGGTVYKTWS